MNSAFHIIIRQWPCDALNASYFYCSECIKVDLQEHQSNLEELFTKKTFISEVQASYSVVFNHIWPISLIRTDYAVLWPVFSFTHTGDSCAAHVWFEGYAIPMYRSMANFPNGQFFYLYLFPIATVRSYPLPYFCSLKVLWDPTIFNTIAHHFDLK